MTRLLLLLASSMIALAAGDAVVGGFRIDDVWPTLVVAGAVFGVVNWLVKPVVTVLSLPLIIVTLGLALLLVNALMLAITAGLVPGVHLDGFWPAVGAALVVSVVNWAVSSAVGARD